jgi:AcrR family transcriptional regulator
MERVRDRVPIREKILDAAAEVLRDSGLAHTTTREIARVAGCSEGSLYTYFPNKENLFYSVLTERLPPFVSQVGALLEKAGEGDVQEHLIVLTRTALAFYLGAIPMATASLTAPELCQSLLANNRGPHRANEGLARYLRLEQRLGRVRPDVSPEAAAALLLGACQQRAFHKAFRGEASFGDQEQGFAEDLVQALMLGIEPA